MPISAATFHDLVSGRRRGPLPAAARALLRVAETPYTWAIRWRNRKFDAPDAVERVSAPVVSVGNLTMGGTGKTPLVEFLARWYRDRDVRVTIVSRGYGAEAGSRNDEALELEQRLPDVPHLQDADRVLAARMAIEEFECQLVLLDDGFQHRRLARDLDIVLLDALEPWGYGHVFPRGALREPVESLSRAQVVVLSRRDLVGPEDRARIRTQVAKLAPQAAWVEVSHRPLALRNSEGTEAPLDSLRGQRVAAFCGIGNPEGFRRTLEACGYEIAGFEALADHHRYTREDVSRLGRWGRDVGAEALVCTHKDLVKLAVPALGGLQLLALHVGVEVCEGQEALDVRLAGLLPRG
jgi:tetraacyldisaccharide 4'-kinase